MSAPPEPWVGTTALLTVHSGAAAWAIPSLAVTSVERLAAGATSDAPDALALLGLVGGSGGELRRVLLLRAGGEQARVLVRGEIALTHAASHELLPLPPELTASAPLVSHVALMAGKLALFVVSPERLLRASRGTTEDSPPTDTDAVRGSSC
ncbi:MAG: hypothetical protein EOO73_14780 [Myxococcales bacterium]|nr:MAG: hypothetical protein EOO73_14780 [Myxococcales bacterium]